MKYTDKIWTAFEQDFKTFPMPPGVEIIAFETYKAAYAKGQRDLIDEMGEPVAWVRRHPDGGLTDRFIENDVIEPVRKQSGAWVPLYRLPEDKPK